MKTPKIGDVVYAVNEPQGRVGETTFLCSTQENCEKTLERALEAAKEVYQNSDLQPDEIGEIIVWKMTRVR